MRCAFLLFAFLLILGCDSNDPEFVKTKDPSFSNLKESIKDGIYGDTHSLLVFYQDELLMEEYFGDFGPDSLHYMYSVSKSVVSTLVGIAYTDGLIRNLDTPLLSFFQEYDEEISEVDEKQNITLEHALTMTTGLEWDEWTFPYLDERNDANKLAGSEDMYEFVLDLPLESEPGTDYTYNSGVSILLGGVVASASGMSITDYTTSKLFEPLGIENWFWSTGPKSVENTGWGLYLRPLDMLKIGKLFLQNGVFDSKRMISEEWITKATTPYSPGYGYQWWITDTEYSARGWGGQFIYVAPDDDLIVVVTAGNFEGGIAHQLYGKVRQILEL